MSAAFDPLYIRVKIKINITRIVFYANSGSARSQDHSHDAINTAPRLP